MKRFLFVVIFLLTRYLILAQLSICNNENKGLYWPLTINIKKHYFSNYGNYTVIYTSEKLIVAGRTYIKEVTSNEDNTIETLYLREENGNIYVYDTIKKIEFLEFSNNTTPGYSWKKYDGTWLYTIIDTSATLKTPYCDYNNILNVKAEPQGKLKKDYSSYYNLFYNRGIGLVAIEINGKATTFLSIDPNTDIEVEAVHIDCSKITNSDERLKCNSEKITNFISQKFNRNIKTKAGKLVFGLVINKTGEVESIELLDGTKYTEAQLTEIKRLLMLIKFTPRTINNVPYESTISLPITF